MNSCRFSRVSSISVRRGTAAWRRRRRWAARPVSEVAIWLSTQTRSAEPSKLSGWAAIQPSTSPSEAAKGGARLQARQLPRLGRDALGQEVRHPARERAGIWDRLAFDDPRLVEQQPRQLVELHAA